MKRTFGRMFGKASAGVNLPGYFPPQMLVVDMMGFEIPFNHLRENLYIPEFDLYCLLFDHNGKIINSVFIIEEMCIVSYLANSKFFSIKEEGMPSYLDTAPNFIYFPKEEIKDKLEKFLLLG